MVAGRPATGFYDKAFMGIGGPRIAMMHEIHSALRRGIEGNFLNEEWAERDGKD